MRRELFFFLAFHPSKRLKFVLGLPKQESSTGKKYLMLGKKIKKNDFAPSEKYSCYAPASEGLIMGPIWYGTVAQYSSCEQTSFNVNF